VTFFRPNSPLVAIPGYWTPLDKIDKIDEMRWRLRCVSGWLKVARSPRPAGLRFLRPSKRPAEAGPPQQNHQNQRNAGWPSCGTSSRRTPHPARPDSVSGCVRQPAGSSGAIMAKPAPIGSMLVVRCLPFCPKPPAPQFVERLFLGGSTQGWVEEERRGSGMGGNNSRFGAEWTCTCRTTA
jgi:hypothetical protein